jgi:glucokinase
MAASGRKAVDSASSILLADIGGTNARFAILEDGKLGCIAAVQVADFASPEDALRAYLANEGRGHAPEAAAIAAAGPVIEGKVALTNASWSVDGASLREALRLRSAAIVNDFAALAWSLPALGAGDVRAMGRGSPVARAPTAVLGPGTGFGIAALLREGGRESVLVSEGGHATLAGESRREDAIIDALRGAFGHLSVERVLSGDGLGHLYDAVVALDGIAAPKRTAAEIVARALSGGCSASARALELFCAFLGSVAGNVALTFGAGGGIYIGGGMVPHFVEYLVRSPFRERFEAKGRMRGYLAAIPTRVITHPHPAFLGLERFLNARET